MRKIERLLLVDDDLRLIRALETALAPITGATRHARTALEACELLDRFRPDVMLLDVTLAEGTAFDVLEHCRGSSPCPLIVSMSGSADPSETFRLAELGVRAYLPKPLDLPGLCHTLERVLAEPPPTEPHVRNSVGFVGLKELQVTVRRTMLDEALERSGGSLTRAARLLGVTRQALQNLRKRQ
ncbi:MAG TPA: response regulator [Polyangiaceae bacterium]